MGKFSTALITALALASMLFTAEPIALAEPVPAEISRDNGEITLAQALRERGASNRYQERIRLHLHMARQGDAASLREIGFYYAKGWGVIRDLTKAYMWFSLAVQEGNEEAAYNRDKVARALDASEIFRAEEMAAEWLATHEWALGDDSLGG